ncbi:MAG: RAD55 family ATPase [Candidatus Bathyarchaeota archaeon]
MNILITGPPGVGKSVLCENLMADCLQNEVEVIYVCLDTSPEEIRSKVLKRDLKKSAKLSFIDGYSWLLNEIYEKHYVANLSNLSDLSIQIFNYLNEHRDEPKIIIFDSISTLFVHNSERDITRFIQVNTARIRDSACICFWTVEEGIHSQAFYNSLNHMTDGIIQTRLVEDQELKRFVRVHTFKGHLHSTHWVPFNIQYDGTVALVMQ